MAGKTRNMVNRSGRYFARLVVPKTLRPILGKTELRTALGGDYRTALKALPAAVADLQRQITAAERQIAGAHPLDQPPIVARYPMTPAQIAASHYAQRLALDEQFRMNPAYALVGINDAYFDALKIAIAGKADDRLLTELVGAEVEFFRRSGNHDAEPGSRAWREVAQAIAVAEVEFIKRSYERDLGRFDGRPDHPMIRNTPQPEDTPEPVSLSKLWDDYLAASSAIGGIKDGGARQRPVIASFRKFLGTDNALKVTRKHVMDWRDDLMGKLSAKTVNDIYLSTVRALFNWAVEGERLPENVAATVRQKKPKRVRGREAGYTDAEAVKVLKASRSYQPNADGRGRIRETPQSVAAKRWVPLLCAFTGARVSEITQLRKEDFRNVDGRVIVRITPDAGSVKIGNYRDVPLHAQVMAEGFEDFLKGQGAGPLFHTGRDEASYPAKAQRMSNQLADWLREAEIVPAGLQPNHAWRHRLKSQGRELGADPRVVDAIQGHAARTAGENYGDVSLKAKARVIDMLPAYDLTPAQ